jgi:hypothetical protein
MTIEFKAPPPKQTPLACSVHGNSLSCPGVGQCAGVLGPSPAAKPAAALSHAALTDAAADIMVAALDDEELEVLYNAAIAELERRWNAARARVVAPAAPSAAPVKS